MTVRVVLEFDNEEGAKAFVKNTTLDGCVYGDRVSDYPEDDRVSYLTKVVAVFKKPSKFCDASDGHRGGRKTYMGWSRGKKYGWFVCTLCGKPTEKWAIGTQWFHTLGTNLLPAKYFPEARPAQGWDSPVAWTAEELGLEHPKAPEVECNYGGVYYIDDAGVSRCTECDKEH